MRNWLRMGWSAATALVLAASVAHGAAPAEDETKKALERAKATAQTTATEGGTAATEEGTATEDAKPPRAVTKTRRGSLLKRETPFAVAVDLRGELERRRDFEVLRHYTRVAELDVIEALARATDDAGLAERVETVRRKEQRRYIEIMQRLREMARRRSQAGKP